MWRYVEDSLAYIFGGSTGSGQADRLLAVVEEAGPAGITLTQVTKQFSGHLDAGARDRAVAALVQRGLIVSTQEPTSGRPIVRLTAVAQIANNAKEAC